MVKKIETLVPLEQIDYGRGIWGSYYNILEAIFYVLKGNYTPLSNESKLFRQECLASGTKFYT